MTPIYNPIIDLDLVRVSGCQPCTTTSQYSRKIKLQCCTSVELLTSYIWTWMPSLDVLSCPPSWIEISIYKPLLTWWIPVCVISPQSSTVYTYGCNHNTKFCVVSWRSNHKHYPHSNFLVMIHQTSYGELSTSTLDLNTPTFCIRNYHDYDTIHKHLCTWTFTGRHVILLITYYKFHLQLSQVMITPIMNNNMKMTMCILRKTLLCCWSLHLRRRPLFTKIVIFYVIKWLKFEFRAISANES